MSIITINGTARLVYVARITIQFSPGLKRENPKELEKRHEAGSEKKSISGTIAELFISVFTFFQMRRGAGRLSSNVDGCRGSPSLD
jgi:hypothetical protein